MRTTSGWKLATKLGMAFLSPFLVTMASADFYYSVQDGFWHDASTWSNAIPETSGIPSTGDTATVRHEVAATQSVEVLALNLYTGRMNMAAGTVVHMRGTGTWEGATLEGLGEFFNQGKLNMTGMPPNQVNCRFENGGTVEIVQTPSLHLNGRFNNETQSTFRLSPGMNSWTLQGTGFFRNAGTFWVGSGSTGVVSGARFAIDGGNMNLQTGSSFQVFGRRETNVNGSYQLAAGSTYVPVLGGTSYYSGAHSSMGPGQFSMRTGALHVGYFTTSNPSFNMQGGGFSWEGGTLNVHPAYRLQNHGTMTIGGTGAVPLLLQGTLDNFGNVVIAGPTSNPFQVAGTIYNEPSGTWMYQGENPVLQGSGASEFYNRTGQVRFAMTGTGAVNITYFQQGGTTSVERGWARFGGAAVVNGGRFVMIGGQWIGHSLFVQSGATVGGTGTMMGNVYQGSGTLSPGHSPGELAIEGDFVQQSTDSTLRMEIDSIDPGIGYDQLTVGGTGTLSGTLTVELLNGYEPPAAARFDLIRAAERTGEFAFTNLPPLSGDRVWVVRYFTNAVQLRVATPEDTDGDGLRDEWETNHFGNLNDSDGGDNDYDEDHYSDHVEMICDTDPKNPLDRLAIGRIESNGELAWIQMHTASNVHYAVDARETLSDAHDWTQVDVIVGIGGEQGWTNAVSDSRGILRVRLVP